MITLRAANKQQLLDSIKNIPSAEAAEVYLNKRPTPEILQAIISQAPGVKTVSCPPSFYKQIAKQAHAAFENRLSLRPGTVPTGRPPKYTPAFIETIRSQYAAGKPAKQIANDLQVPLRTVYYYLQLQRNRQA